MALFVAVVLYEMFDSGLSRLFLGPVVETADGEKDVGFRPVDCWFSEREGWPESDCYYMQVPESHDQAGGRVISFPVVVFHSDAIVRYKNPVLHLGAGGPGSATELDSAESLKRIWQYFSRLSIDQGRDLYVMDPRGAGLARPALGCASYVEKSRRWLSMDLSLREEQELLAAEYGKCIREYQDAGVRLREYNSASVARDVEVMREKANVDRWVLYGVSYATLYAQVIARTNPSSVEAMVLDSPVMAGRTGDVGFIERMKAPYELMRRQCTKDEVCSTHPRGFMERISALRSRFNDTPKIVDTKNPYTGEEVRIVLNGDRLLSIFLVGMYYENFISEVVSIVQDLERGEFGSIDPYIGEYVGFVLDETYSDISMEAHFCYDREPFLNVDKMRARVDREFHGVAREITLAGLEYPNQCDLVGNKGQDPVLSEGAPIEIPTLFLSGDLDTITPVRDVISQKHLYSNSRLLRFEVSHSVFDAHECAHYASGWFVENPEIPQWRLYCQ